MKKATRYKVGFFTFTFLNGTCWYKFDWKVYGQRTIITGKSSNSMVGELLSSLEGSDIPRYHDALERFVKFNIDYRNAIEIAEHYCRAGYVKHLVQKLA
jgi:hypothetical protein